MSRKHRYRPSLRRRREARAIARVRAEAAAFDPLGRPVEWRPFVSAMNNLGEAITSMVCGCVEALGQWAGAIRDSSAATYVEAGSPRGPVGTASVLGWLGDRMVEQEAARRVEWQRAREEHLLGLSANLAANQPN